MQTYLIILIGLISVFLITIYGVSQNEYFGNYGLQKKNNLISNGSFENGLDIKEKIKAEGDNEIVILENPGASSYVLKQSHVPNAENYYLLRVKVEPSEHYLLNFHYHCENGSDLEETLLKLEIKDKNHRNHTLQGNTSIQEKAKVDGREWNRVHFHFQTPSSLLDNYLYIYVGYNMTNGTRYYTDVGLHKYLTDAPRFNVTNGLQVLLEGANLDPAEHIHNMIWKDSSEKGHDFEWYSKPNYHPDGYYQTYGNSLEGNNGKVILNETQFTIGINVEVTETVPKPTANLTTPTTSLTTPTATLTTSATPATQLDTVLTNLSNNLSTLDNLTSLNTPTTPLKTPTTQLEDDAKLLVENYRELIRVPGNNSLALQVLVPLFYGKMILIIGDVRYQTDKDIISHNNNTYSFVYDGTRMKVYVNNALISTIQPRQKIHFNNQPIVINFNRNMRANLYNVIMYNRLLNTSEIAYVVKYFSQGGMSLLGRAKSQTQRWFHHLGGGGKPSTPLIPPHTEPSCQIGPGTGGPGGTGGIGGTGGTGGKGGCKGGGCPRVVDKEGEYFVYIPSGSPLEKMIGYCGYKSYGKDQGNARKIFQLNFPECQVPDILIQPRRHHNFNKCPYIIRDGNPCFSQACANVDWNIKNPAQACLSDACKRDINSYCDKNSAYDPACYCWKPPNRDTRECVDFRRNFLNPKDYNCKVDRFKIEEHPDISDYIRKDRIPCWGCNLSGSGRKQTSASS